MSRAMTSTVAAFGLSFSMSIAHIRSFCRRRTLFLFFTPSIYEAATKFSYVSGL
jgi:hypothetical protein